MPIVSVIVPNYNHAPYLRERIESILRQGYQDFELILLDDCSTDGSREVLEEYRKDPHVSHVVYNTVNGGTPFAQWDKGIALAKGEWIWIAESDDYAEPNFLERLMGAVTERCTLAFAATYWVDDSGMRLWETPNMDETMTYDGRDFIRQRLTCNNTIANVSECVFRRSAYHQEDSHLYERMRLCGDWFFYVLLALRGDVVELTKPLSNYRQHGSNTSDGAEHRGLTFLEGADILDYIKNHVSPMSRGYAKAWGRLWTKYEQTYAYTKEVNDAISGRLRQGHRNIVRWHRLYMLRNALRHKKKKGHAKGYGADADI